MSKTNSRVSVIMPVYNGEKFVAEAVGSVLCQTYQNFELIVVDDGSTDTTTTILKRYGRRLTLIQRPHVGVATARNAGIQASRGEFVALIDSDDIWEKPKLE